MPKKDRGLEILENIKKNDPRFKDIIVKKFNNIWTPKKELHEILESKTKENQNSL